MPDTIKLIVKISKNFFIINFYHVTLHNSKKGLSILYYGYLEEYYARERLIKSGAIDVKIFGKSEFFRFDPYKK